MLAETVEKFGKSALTVVVTTFAAVIKFPRGNAAGGWNSSAMVVIPCSLSGPKFSWQARHCRSLVCSTSTARAVRYCG